MSEPPPRAAYQPGDQVAKVGPPPWDLLDERVADWERAHGHDVRSKCLPEHGCLVLEDDAYWRGWHDAIRYVELRHATTLPPEVGGSAEKV